MKHEAQFFRTLDKTKVFKIDPEAPEFGYWCMYRDGKWVDDQESMRWFHRIIMSDYTDYEKTRDRKVFEQWLKEADELERLVSRLIQI